MCMLGTARLVKTFLFNNRVKIINLQYNLCTKLSVHLNILFELSFSKLFIIYNEK